jgi:hypothetical protein
MMTKKNVLKSGLLLIIVIGLTLLVSNSRRSEPVFHGKRLSVWLDAFSNGLITTDASPAPSGKIGAQIEARAALRDAGTNALPILLKLVEANDGAIKAKILMLFRKQTLIPFRLRTEQESHNIALCGFIFLGPTGKPAVPRLLELLNDRHPNVRRSAARALSSIGAADQNAVPELMKHLDDQNIDVREAVTNALARIASKALANGGTK